MRSYRTKKEDAIKLLNEGWEVYNSRNENFGNKGQLIYSSITWELYNGKESRLVHHSTIEALKKSGIINKHKPYNLIKK